MPRITLTELELEAVYIEIDKAINDGDHGERSPVQPEHSSALLNAYSKIIAVRRR